MKLAPVNGVNVCEHVFVPEIRFIRLSALALIFTLFIRYVNCLSY